MTAFALESVADLQSSEAIVSSREYMVVSGLAAGSSLSYVFSYDLVFPNGAGEAALLVTTLLVGMCASFPHFPILTSEIELKEESVVGLYCPMHHQAVVG